ncbi:FCD domain-containing protein [Corynebacterium poyangense]|uniref:FCD domain-containing protein n=1 Tax=Corynebacterium poyangense TaxID=2684405 RepID=A0A7H0SQ34_9CORY|nr:GntR family transcriptional regulator [Corynebacterium poyangense]MBZ8178406.1 FCD domain-containing protein [Corynebacterium poyangense]QNQ90659.1 FCD domain-containing protein [Corynebacterium poyangense]
MVKPPAFGDGTNLSMTEEVMIYVRDAVHSGKMPADTWFSVYQLSAELGVSRSPVRDALLRLEEAGLVRFTRNRGFQIVKTQPQDVAEIFALRLEIEPAAAFRAARRYLAEPDFAQGFQHHCQQLVDSMVKAAKAQDAEAFFDIDMELHQWIMEAGLARRGSRFVQQLRSHTRILGPSTAGTSRSFQTILDEHLPVIAAIEHGEAQTAKSAMYRHIANTGQLLLTQALKRSKAEDPEQEAAIIWRRYTEGCGDQT